MIIIGGPYSHKNPEVKEERVKIIANACIKVMAEGRDHVAMSPLLYGLTLIEHTKTDDNKLPDSTEFWNLFCLEFINKGSEFYVLNIEGWDESEGLSNEIKQAKKLNIPVYLMDKQTLEYIKVL